MYKFVEKLDAEDGWVPPLLDDEVAVHAVDWNDADRIGVVKVSTLKWLMEEHPSDLSERLWSSFRVLIFNPRGRALDEEVGLFFEWGWSVDQLVEALDDLYDVDESFRSVQALQPDTVYTTFAPNQERWLKDYN